MALQDEQRPIDQEICYGVCDSIPRSWEHIHLKARRDANGIRLTLRSMEPAGEAKPVPRLEQAVTALFALNDRYGTDLCEAHYIVHWTAEGLRFELECTYAT
jgi:hypothetical protein